MTPPGSTTSSQYATSHSTSQVRVAAKNHQAPYELIEYCAKHGKLPVPNFSAGGIATPAVAALMMKLGAETVFVGSGIYKSPESVMFAKAIVKATLHFKDASKILEAMEELPDGMKGLDVRQIPEEELMAGRGW